MAVQGMEHFTVLAEDLEATRTFYGDILGLEEGYRPPLGFPGAWLYVGGRAVLHVIAGRALPADEPEDASRHDRPEGEGGETPLAQLPDGRRKERIFVDRATSSSRRRVRSGARLGCGRRRRLPGRRDR